VEIAILISITSLATKLPTGIELKNRILAFGKQRQQQNISYHSGCYGQKAKCF